MTMATEIGKTLKRIRIDNDERLLDMSKRLGKSASFLSAVEVGKKAPPSGFEEAVIKAYKLAGDAAEAVRKTANRSRRAFVLEPSTAAGRDTAGLLARKMNSLSTDQLREIQDIVNRKRAK